MAASGGLNQWLSSVSPPWGFPGQTADHRQRAANKSMRNLSQTPAGSSTAQVCLPIPGGLTCPRSRAGAPGWGLGRLLLWNWKPKSQGVPLLSQKIIILSAYFLPETLPSTTQVSAWEGAPFTEASEETLAPSLACPQWSHNCVPAAAAAVYVLTNLGTWGHCPFGLLPTFVPLLCM